MIRLVVISDSPPTITRYFDQPTVTIGSATSPFADLSLSEDMVHDSHVQIIQEQQRFYAINVVNDPFATVNGKPFGKKALNPNDIIQIGNAVIRFENELPVKANPPVPPVAKRPSFLEREEEQSFNWVDTKELLPIILEKKFAEHAETLEQIPNPSLYFDVLTGMETLPSASQTDDIFHEDYFNNNNEILFEDPPEWTEDETSDFDIESLVRQVEELADKETISTGDQKGPTHSGVYIDESPSFLTSSTHSEYTPPPQVPHPLAESLAVTAVEPLKEPPPIQMAHPSPKPSSTIPKLSLKDYYLSEYDDVSESSSAITDDSSSSIPKILLSIHNWIIYLKLIGVLAVIASIALGLVYLWMTDQSDKEEITASKGVADVAMALTYAQIKNIHPQNQNWSDPEFIKNNLTAVLPSKYFSHADFDTHGQFANCPYFLRIYTSGDLSQFLVIAQPAPSVLQWLIPKSTIIIDSRAMEMRKTRDLKSLNRLLVNSNTLDGTSAVEVSHLVRQGTLIPLISLVNKTENIGFAPPKALALIRPGAENLVYNAPRYFPLSEELMKKSVDLIEKPASSHEVARLQQELAALSKFPDAVLYSSGGIQNAIHAQKALTTLSPKEKFLIAYLQVNSKGQVANSHLLMDDTIQEVAMAEGIKPVLLNTALKSSAELSKETQASFETTQPESQESTAMQSQGNEIDEDNPLFLQLSALNVFRQQALRPLSEEIIALLNQETQAAHKNFEAKIKQLLAKYIDIDNEQQAKIQRKLDGIYRENTHVSASQFFHLAKVAGLKQSLKDYLSHLKQLQHAPEYTQEKLDKHLQKIEKAQNWQTFEQEVAELIEILSLERIPDEETIISFQNATRSRIIQKLNQFILSPEHPQLLQVFDQEYRYTLIHILKMSWITDADTYDFYLSEFDLRAHPRGSVQTYEVDDEEG